MRIKLAILFSWLIFPSSLWAAATIVGFAPPFRARLWQTGDDAARNAIQAIAQTADGFLWVGTQGGLARFDGEHFEFVPIPGTRAPRVNAVCAARDGSLWVGTAKGLFQFLDGKWITHAVPLGAEETILSIFCRADGTAWIGTRTGLLHFQNGKLSVVGDPASLPHYPNHPSWFYAIRAMARSEQGELWAGTDDRIMVLRDDLPQMAFRLAELKPYLIRSICCSRDGSIWIGSNSGLTRLKDAACTHFTRAEGLPDNTVTAVYEDRRGNLWIGTYGGLCRMVNGKFLVETTREAEPFDQVFCFFEDREGNLWVGVKDGLYQLGIQQFRSYTTRSGLMHNNVTSVYEDNQTNLWIGTWGGGLHCLRDGKMIVYSTANTPLMRNDLILAIHGARDGGIWFGEDYDGGLYHVKNGAFQRYGESYGLAGNAIRTLLEDENRRLFIGRATASLIAIENGKITFEARQHGILTSANRCLLQTADGRIWLGTEAGLSCATNDFFVTFTTKDGLLDNTVLSLYEDRQHTLWIGTGRGLCWTKNRKTFEFHHSRFIDNAIVEILEDDFENLWLATHLGVVRVGKKNLRGFAAGKPEEIPVTIFGKDDGMNSPVCVGVAKPSACKTRDGRLWFATTKGLAVTDPKLQITKNETPPPVAIKKVLANKQSFEVEHSNDSPSSNLKPRTLNLKPSQDELEFHYTALSYTAPEKNRFKYKLEGLDNDWVEAESRRTAYYNNVPPGNYTFRVVACNNDGVWNSLGANVKLTLPPHYWQTAWFKILVTACGVFLVAVGVRSATRKRIQLKLERLEHQHAVEKERSRIAQDMHDNLGACATEILLLSNLARDSKGQPEKIDTHLARISDSAREVVRSLDGIVWAVNPENDSLAGLAGYIHEYAEQFLSATPIRCRLDLPRELPPAVLSSEVRHNLFLVIKEAMNNAVKHSQATEMTIRLVANDGILSVIVEDNGKGFSPSAPAGFGNGLRNMRKRMEKAGGQLEITSAPQKGAQIKIQIPLKSVSLTPSHGRHSH